MKKEDKLNLVYPVSYEIKETNNYYDPFDRHKLKDRDEISIMPDCEYKLQFEGIDLQTGEDVYHTSTYINSWENITYYDPVFKKYHVLFTSHIDDCYTNAKYIKERKVRYSNVLYEYFKLVVERKDSEEIIKTMMSNYNPRKAKVKKKTKIKIAKKKKI